MYVILNISSYNDFHVGHLWVSRPYGQWRSNRAAAPPPPYPLLATPLPNRSTGDHKIGYSGRKFKMSVFFYLTHNI